MTSEKMEMGEVFLKTSNDSQNLSNQAKSET